MTDKPGTGKITVAGLLGAFKADGFLGKTASGQGTGQKFSESLFLVFDHFFVFVEMKRVRACLGRSAADMTKRRSNRPPICLRCS